MFLGVIDGMAMGMPDVCKTPPFAIPTPYPNIWDLSMTSPVPTVMIGGLPSVNLMSKGFLSQGDEVGVMGGVISSMIMGMGMFMTGAPNILIAGAPAVVMGQSMTMQNTNNAPGNVMLVGQMAAMAAA